MVTPSVGKRIVALQKHPHLLQHADLSAITVQYIIIVGVSCTAVCVNVFKRLRSLSVKSKASSAEIQLHGFV